MEQISITQIEGVRVGNAQNEQDATGCTVIICEDGACAGIDVRGGGPASRETALLSPLCSGQQIHAVMLSGGSAFGLEAGDGAMQFLSERGIGFDTAVAVVPIVCGASLFDLGVGSNTAFPDKAMGYEACVNAFSGVEPQEGNAGAGTGATVGKLCGASSMMKSGLGIFAAQIGEVQVGAVVAVNALGDVIDYDTKQILAGMLEPDGANFANTQQHLYNNIERQHDVWHTNTTLACVVTNAALNKSMCNKLASIAHNGFAQTIRPVHTTADGDTAFLMSTGKVEADVDAVGALVVECVARAINRAVALANPAYGLKAACDF